MSMTGSQTDDFFENVDERRLRLAKRVLDKIGNEPTEQLIKRLKHKADEVQKKIEYKLADELTIGDSTFYSGHKGSLTCLAVGTDETSIITGAKDCALIKWDIETGKKIIFPGRRKHFSCGGHFEQVLSACINEAGNIICSGGADRVVRLWDARAFKSGCFDAMFGHTGNVTGMQCDPKNRDMYELYSCSSDKSVRVWNLHYRRPVDTLLGHTRCVTSIDMSDSLRPITVGEDNSLRLWKVERNSYQLFEKHSSPVDACTAVTSHNVVTGEQNGHIALWSLSNRRPLCWIEGAHSGRPILSLACIQRSDTIFSGSDDGCIRVWKTVGRVGNKQSKDSKVSMYEVAQIPVCGFVNAITLSRSKGYLYAAIGKEHRHGRWLNCKEAKNGILIVKLSHSAIGK